jgi:poly(3-hydroxybutyrate) depolymerase
VAEVLGVDQATVSRDMSDANASLGAADAIEAEEADDASASTASAYRCSDCGEGFDAPVWHCPGCGHHWPLAETQCRNCHKAAPTPHVAHNAGDNTGRAVTMLPKSIIEELDQAAIDEGLSRSALMRTVLIRYLKERKGSE